MDFDEDSSPWGHADFKRADEGNAESVSSYNWGHDVQSDFFSDLLSSSKAKVYKNKFTND